MPRAAHLGEDVEPAVEARPAVGRVALAVGLVKAGLEDDGEAEASSLEVESMEDEEDCE